MSAIRYVCLSDLHFGEEDGLLTHLESDSGKLDVSKASPVLEKLVECLKRLIFDTDNGGEKPTLILVGDVLELALSTTDQAAMAFERFVNLVMPAPPARQLFGNIVYVPGNHDHHLWEVARESQYVESVAEIPGGGVLQPARHTTNVFDDLVSSYPINKLLRRYHHLKDIDVKVAYPNYGVISEDGKRCAVFHHGHLTEPIYLLMSRLRNLALESHQMPVTLEEIESENFAWIDFFWSMMGRSAKAGAVIETIYENMLDPEHFEQLARRFIKAFSKLMAENYDLIGPGDSAEAKILEVVLLGLLKKLGKRERAETETALSEESKDCLRGYLQDALKTQLKSETQDKIPEDFTFVFGHTHKPFCNPPEQHLDIKGYSGRTRVYNTGGWVIDKLEENRIYGAAVILFDEQLNSTSLQMYRESQYQVQVVQAKTTGEPFNALHQEVSNCVESTAGLWQGFADTVAKEAGMRRQNLRKRLDKKRPRTS